MRGFLIAGLAAVPFLWANFVSAGARAEISTVVEVTSLATGKGVQGVPLRITNLRNGESVLGRTDKVGRVRVRRVPVGNYCLGIGLKGAALPEQECCAYRKLGYRDVTVRFRDTWLCDSVKEIEYLHELALHAREVGDEATVAAIVAHTKDTQAQHSRALVELMPLYDETWAELFGQLSPELQRELTESLRRTRPTKALKAMRLIAERRARERAAAPRTGGTTSNGEGEIDGEGRVGPAANGKAESASNASNTAPAPNLQGTVTLPDGSVITIVPGPGDIFTSGLNFPPLGSQSQPVTPPFPKADGTADFGSPAIPPGHFYRLIGYEVVTSPDNFFYSHEETMMFDEPFTHTGILAQTRNNNVEPQVYSGWTLGWDTGFDQGDRDGFLGDLPLTPGGGGGGFGGGNN